MILVKDKNLRDIGVLENAFEVSVTRRVNELWTASFSLPKNDEKNALCSHLNYVDITSPTGRYYGLYRIMPTMTTKSESDDKITYTCQHVLSTLMDDVLDGYHQFTNQTTRYVLQALLDRQETKHWRLGDVEFTRYFHYAFENENGLLAPILSIPEPINEPFEFTFDTTSYPWTLNLKRVSDDVKAEIRWGKDMISFEEVSDPTSIVNYIIPKGSGEGVNQLTIKDVNGGRNYLKDDASIAKWGKISYIWIDRRFEDAESLKANAQALLDKWKEPSISFTVDAADLSVLPKYAHEKRVLNGVTRIIVEDKTYFGRIIEENIPDIADEFNVNYKVANRLDDIATIQADVERKQQINDAYSQGATNINVIPYNENCDHNFPAVIEFPFPKDMVHVNESKLRIRTSPFRTHVKGNEAGGHYVRESIIEAKSTEAGGGSTSGPSSVTTSGPSSRTTSEAGGDHRHRVFKYVANIEGSAPTRLYQPYDAGAGVYLESSLAADLWTEGSSGNHSHNMDHTHNINHTHSLPTHRHDFSVTIPPINIPAHTHPMIYGIYEYDKMPTRLTVKVDGVTVPFNGLEGEIDITNYLRKSDGKVTRDWHTVEVSPNDLARIDLVLINRFFCQSHIGQQL